MIEFLPLNVETAPLAYAVYKNWSERISYYFPVGLESFIHSLFSQPEVHPVSFEIHSGASRVAAENGKPVGWIQAGYITGLPSIPAGQSDALIRCLMVAPGRRETAAGLLDRAMRGLAERKVRAWRAFEHSSGYTFAAGIGKAPQKMEEVTEVLAGRNFQPEEINLVYTTEDLQPYASSGEPAGIKSQILLKGFREQGAAVEWDMFNFTEGENKVGSATVIPVKRLTGWHGEKTLFIKGFSVEEKYHRRGIGRLIMKTVWEYYLSQGINRIILNTGETNIVAQKFYQAVGFRVSDRIYALLTTEPLMKS